MNLLAAPIRLAAQPARRLPHVGYLFSFILAEGRHLWEACRQGLRELGYVEGQNIVLEPRWADGRHERLPELAAELVRLRVDVIVSAATPASRAAKAATSSIPIVIVAIGEPVKMGLIASTRPGGNITGVSLPDSGVERQAAPAARAGRAQHAPRGDLHESGQSRSPTCSWRRPGSLPRSWGRSFSRSRPDIRGR